jgi:uncharacterized protein YbjQ (UPF0145 family)
MITTTTDHIEGYRITEYLGVVFADAPDFRFPNRYINEPKAWHMEYDEEKADAIIGIQYVMAGRDRSFSSRLIGTAVKIEKE